MEIFAEISNGRNLLLQLCPSQNSILDVWLGSEYASVQYLILGKFKYWHPLAFLSNICLQEDFENRKQ